MFALDIVQDSCALFLVRVKCIDGNVGVGKVFTDHVVCEGRLRIEAGVAVRNFFRCAVHDHLVGLFIVCGDIVQQDASDLLCIALGVVGHAHEGVEAGFAEVEGDVSVFLAVAIFELGDNLCVVVRCDGSSLVLDLRRGELARICGEDHLVHVDTEGHVHRYFAVVAEVGLGLNGVIHAGVAVDDGH